MTASLVRIASVFAALLATATLAVASSARPELAPRTAAVALDAGPLA